MSALTPPAWALAGAVAVPNILFLAEVTLGLTPGRRRVPPPGPLASVAVVVPAHDEEAVFAPGGVGRGLTALRDAGARVLVVADNCSDNTAAAARAMGLEVAERRDPDRRGKGYALAHGRDALAADPPGVAVVLDADCDLDPASLALLAGRAAQSGRPVQAAYLLRPDRGAGPTVQISNFAFAVKNLVRQRGAARLADAATLGGTGMAFPWPLFASAELATGEVVEDLALGVDLVRAGAAPLFEEHARVWSAASSEAGTREQRARWEGGFLSVAGRYAPGLVARGIGRGRRRELWLGLHLTVPPLALLLSVDLGLLAALALLGAAGAGWAPALAGAAMLGAVGAAVLATWAAVGRPYLSASALVRVPLYVGWKLALYARLALGRQRLSWTRTERVERP